MTFEGPIFVGGPNVTLQGTLEDIVAQINATNPQYFLTNDTGSGNGAASKDGAQDVCTYASLPTRPR